MEAGGLSDHTSSRATGPRYGFTHIDELGFLAFLMGMKIYNSCGNRLIYLAPSSRQDFGKAEVVLILGFLAMNTALLFS